MPLCLHVDLIGSIPPYHVQYRKTSAWVLVDPCGQVQGIPLMNNDNLIVRNKAHDIGDFDKL